MLDLSFVIFLMHWISFTLVYLCSCLSTDFPFHKGIVKPFKSATVIHISRKMPFSQIQKIQEGNSIYCKFVIQCLTNLLCIYRCIIIILVIIGFISTYLKLRAPGVSNPALLSKYVVIGV